MGFPYAMDCFDDLTMLAYLERRLARRTMAQIRRHVDACQPCVQLLVELSLQRRVRDDGRSAR